MREELLNELMVISEEEKKYRAGQGMVERQLYARESIGEIDRELLLKRGRLITVRTAALWISRSTGTTMWRSCMSCRGASRTSSGGRN